MYCKSMRILQILWRLLHIFNDMNNFMQENKIYWNRCGEISIDRAKNMVEINKGLIARIQNVAPNVIFTHCGIPRKALATPLI